MAVYTFITAVSACTLSTLRQDQRGAAPGWNLRIPFKMRVPDRL